MRKISTSSIKNNITATKSNTKLFKDTLSILKEIEKRSKSYNFLKSSQKGIKKLNDIISMGDDIDLESKKVINLLVDITTEVGDIEFGGSYLEEETSKLSKKLSRLYDITK